MLATHPILLKTLAWAGQSALAVKQASDQSLHVLEEGFAWAAGFIAAVWDWSSDQIVRMTQAPWDTWPLWKQILLVIVAALVAYALYIAARQLWWAAMNVLSAVATFVGTLIVTLPTILLAGAIALAGLWVINNFNSLSSLRSLVVFPGGDAGHQNVNAPSAPPARHGPAEATDSE